MKTYTIERVPTPTHWRQHSPKVYRMSCSKINNITHTIQATADKRQASLSISDNSPQNGNNNAEWVLRRRFWMRLP